MQRSAKLTMHLGDNPGMLSLVHDGNRNVSESLLQEEMGPIVQPPHPTSSPRPGQAGGDPPWGDGDTWDQERAWRRTKQLLSGRWWDVQAPLPLLLSSSEI